MSLTTYETAFPLLIFKSGEQLSQTIHFYFTHEVSFLIEMLEVCLIFIVMSVICWLVLCLSRVIFTCV